jgi:hypothetical protein
MTAIIIYYWVNYLPNDRPTPSAKEPILKLCITINLDFYEIFRLVKSCISNQCGINNHCLVPFAERRADCFLKSYCF